VAFLTGLVTPLFSRVMPSLDMQLSCDTSLSMCLSCVSLREYVIVMRHLSQVFSGKEQHSHSCPGVCPVSKVSQLQHRQPLPLAGLETPLYHGSRAKASGHARYQDRSSLFCGGVCHCWWRGDTCIHSVYHSRVELH